MSDTTTLRVHRLKCHPAMFQDVANGSKVFEVRKDDRGFRIGDILELKEWPQPDVADYHFDTSAYRLPTLRRKVTYILSGGQWGVEPGFVVMGLEVSDE